MAAPALQDSRGFELSLHPAVLRSVDNWPSICQPSRDELLGAATGQRAKIREQFVCMGSYKLVTSHLLASCCSVQHGARLCHGSAVGHRVSQVAEQCATKLGLYPCLQSVVQGADEPVFPKPVHLPRHPAYNYNVPL